MTAVRMAATRPLPGRVVTALLGGYIAIGIFSGLQIHIAFPAIPGLRGAGLVVAHQVLNVLPWIPFTPLIVWDTRRARQTHSWPARAVWHLLFGTALVGIINVFQVALRWLAGKPFWQAETLFEEFAVQWFQHGHGGLLWYALIAIATLAFTDRRVASVAKPTELPVPAEAADRRRIEIRDGATRHRLDVDEIVWIEARGDYVRFHTRNTSYLQLDRMNRLEAELDPGRFVRVHRSAIVNIDHVRAYRPLQRGDYALELISGSTVRLSRRRRPDVMRRLTARPGSGSDR